MSFFLLHKSNMPGVFFTAAAGYIDKEGKILILKRSKKQDYEQEFWEVISGRLEHHILGVKAELQREIREELGQDFNCEVIAPFGTYHFYRKNDKSEEHVGLDYVCRYLGGEVRLSSEYTEYRWIEPGEFKNYHSSDSLKQKIQLFSSVRKWYLDNSSLFSEYS